MTKPIIIAIDGYSSCGKSTLAKALAKKLNYAYVDTGAMYRAVTQYFIQHSIDFQNLTISQLNQHLDNIHITFIYSTNLGFSETYLNGMNVEKEIRGKEVSNMVSEVAQVKTIRNRMVDLQKKSGKDKRLVMDGRDIGTKVFPEAELKIFMTADPQIRAERRFKELKATGTNLSMDEVKENLAKRDFHDTSREENPLKQAADAIVLDNSYLSPEEQLQLVLNLALKKIKD